MNKTQLMKYAEDGVRNRLQAMQLEINELARLFPQIVCHQNGQVPAVLPIVQKKTVKAKPNGKASAPKRTFADRVADCTRYLEKHPGATTKDIAAAMAVFPTYALKVLHAIARPAAGYAPGQGKQMSWDLKKKK